MRAQCGVQVLEHYVRCSRTNNHTVREEACTCIAELAAKIDPDPVRPHVPTMLRTLITCLRDDSWPVSAISCACSHPVSVPPASVRSAGPRMLMIP
jgi:hypothetical protein